MSYYMYMYIKEEIQGKFGLYLQNTRALYYTTTERTENQ